MKINGFQARWTAILPAMAILPGCALLGAGPSPVAIASFDAYARKIEARLAVRQESSHALLATADPTNIESRLQREGIVIEKLTPHEAGNFPGALLHHWRGTVSVPGSGADFERFLKDIDSYPQHFSPQVVRAGIRKQDGNSMQTWMRVRQKHVITVVLDIDYDVEFISGGAGSGFCASRSTRISEIESPGTNRERVLTSSEEHGFLWRLNTYWTWEERDGLLDLQIETISLTRSIPTGLGWIIRPFIESIPRESLEFTLESAIHFLKGQER